MQGRQEMIPTLTKVNYLNALLKVGFSCLDFGSFVSPQAIPQLKDTEEVLGKLEDSSTELLAIIANLRGAQTAATLERISYLGFPLSISETFQQRNTNKSIREAVNAVVEIQELCIKSNKKQVVYLSMAFGNPYGDTYSLDILLHYIDILKEQGIQKLSIADSVGKATKEEISKVFSAVVPAYPDLEIGAHLHARADQTLEKIGAVWDAGCRRIDTAMLGYGGCPMAGDQLVGNISSEHMLQFLDRKSVQHQIDREAFLQAQLIAQSVFNH
jgi:hydroxymethylglutaryl-CoA lyase